MSHNTFNRAPIYAVVEAQSPPDLEKVAKHSGQRPERRNRSKPVPINVSEYLNEDQNHSLRQLEGFGWRLAFIRRQLAQDAVVVVCNDDERKYGVLETDGSINTSAAIQLRH